VPPYIPSYRWWYRPSWNDTWGWFGPGFFVGATVGNALNPYRYDYGNNIIYSGEMVYVNGVPYVSAAEYYRQAAQLANTTPIIIQKETVIKEVNQNDAVPDAAEQAEPKSVPNAPVKAEEEFLPMGSFTLLDAEGKEKPDILIQLATNKSGQIRGNYSNEKDETVKQLAGAVDSKSQRVALRFADDDKTVLECGLWNLTQDTVPLLVHLDEKETEQWTLVRVVKDDDKKEDEPLAP
jgi:hypothetical protein